MMILSCWLNLAQSWLAGTHSAVPCPTPALTVCVLCVSDLPCSVLPCPCPALTVYVLCVPKLPCPACSVLPCLALVGPAPCPALSCLALPCPGQPCSALSCPAPLQSTWSSCSSQGETTHHSLFNVTLLPQGHTLSAEACTSTHQTRYTTAFSPDCHKLQSTQRKRTDEHGLRAGTHSTTACIYQCQLSQTSEHSKQQT